MDMIKQLIEKIDSLNLELNKKTELANAKLSDLFGGDEYIGLGRAERLVAMADRSSTDGLVIPQKKLVYDIFENLQKLIRDVVEITMITKKHLDYNKQELIKLMDTWGSLKLDEINYQDKIKQYEEYTKRLEKERDLLKQNYDFVMQKQDDQAQ